MAIKLRNQTNDELLNLSYASIKVLKDFFRHWSKLESMSLRGDRIATDILVDLKRVTGIDIDYYDRTNRFSFDKRYELGILSHYQYASIAYVLVLGYSQHDIAYMMGVDQSVIAKNLRRGLQKVSKCLVKGISDGEIEKKRG